MASIFIQLFGWIWIGGGFGFLRRIVDNPKDKAMSMDLINNQERGLSPDRIVHLLRILHNLLTKQKNYEFSRPSEIFYLKLGPNFDLCGVVFIHF